MESKVRRLFIVLAAFFITNALIAEFIGVKIFSLERTFGFEPVNWKILGIDLSFNLTTGVLLWPFVFVLTDIINEYFGRKGVRLITYLAVILIGYAFLIVSLAMEVTPADFWKIRELKKGDTVIGTIDMEAAYDLVYGQGLWIIIGSLTAFFIGQLVDVYVFSKLRRITSHSSLWLRATVSTLVSQLIDSFVVLYIAFYIGQGWPFKLVIAVMIMNYIYKFLAAIAFIPILYFIHGAIRSYLTPRLAEQLAASAHKERTLEKA